MEDCRVGDLLAFYVTFFFGQRFPASEINLGKNMKHIKW